MGLCILLLEITIVQQFYHIMKKPILVIRMKQGRLGLKYCSPNCRGAAHRHKHKKKFTDEITRLKNRIKELENENL